MGRKRVQPSPANLLTGRGIDYLRDAGFFAMDFAHYTKMPRKASGWPDVFVAKNDTVWLVEVKAGRDQLRQTQINFFQDIERHLGEHLRYMIAESVDDFFEIIEGKAGIVFAREKHLKKLKEVKYEDYD